MGEGKFRKLIQNIEDCESIVADNWLDPIGKQYDYWVNETVKRLKQFNMDMEKQYIELEKIYEDCERISALVTDEGEDLQVKVKKFSRR